MHAGAMLDSHDRRHWLHVSVSVSARIPQLGYLLVSQPISYAFCLETYCKEYDRLVSLFHQCEKTVLQDVAWHVACLVFLVCWQRVYLCTKHRQIGLASVQINSSEMVQPQAANSYLALFGLASVQINSSKTVQPQATNIYLALYSLYSLCYFVTWNYVSWTSDACKLCFVFSR